MRNHFVACFRCRFNELKTNGCGAEITSRTRQPVIFRSRSSFDKLSMRLYSSNDLPQGTASSYLKAIKIFRLVLQFNDCNCLSSAIFGLEADAFDQRMRLQKFGETPA